MAGEDLGTSQYQAAAAEAPLPGLSTHLSYISLPQLLGPHQLSLIPADWLACSTLTPTPGCRTTSLHTPPTLLTDLQDIALCQTVGKAPALNSVNCSPLLLSRKHNVYLDLAAGDAPMLS